MRAGDLVARQGGDEFVLLIKDLAEAELCRIGERVLDALAQPVVVAGRELTIGCSLGFASWPGDGEDIDTLLKNADAAMYRAKDLGRNNCQFFAPEMSHDEGDRLALASQLHHALARDEFVLHYEPQVEIDSGRIVGVEALVRWNAPQGLMMPNSFIPLAEETGLIVPLGQWVLRAACEQARAWREQGLPVVPVSVNLSRRQLVHGDIAADIAELLDRTGLCAADLQLEITESMVMQDSAKALAMVTRLHDMGVQIALDDFGSGYSSLSEIGRLPVSSLKIDRCFIRDADSDRGAAAITKTIVALGRSLGLTVVAEGVETAAQHALLSELGCPQAQGYLIGRPSEAAVFAQLLQLQAA
jgi:EAL domain-containing protein (putative c-di-GMP-specific phosphodiesterase class I)